VFLMSEVPLYAICAALEACTASACPSTSACRTRPCFSPAHDLSADPHTVHETPLVNSLRLITCPTEAHSAGRPVASTQSLPSKLCGVGKVDCIAEHRVKHNTSSLDSHIIHTLPHFPCPAIPADAVHKRITQPWMHMMARNQRVTCRVHSTCRRPYRTPAPRLVYSHGAYLDDRAPTMGPLSHR